MESFKKIALILLLVTLSNCFSNSNEFEIRTKKINQCQIVTNTDKNTRYKHCKEFVYYECVKRHGSVTLKLFKNLHNANKYCERVRGKAEAKK